MSMLNGLFSFSGKLTRNTREQLSRRDNFELVSAHNSRKIREQNEFVALFVVTFSFLLLVDLTATASGKMATLTATMF